MDRKRIYIHKCPKKSCVSTKRIYGSIETEAGREKVGKKGVVREKSTHIEVIEMVSRLAIMEGFKILDLDFSPIKGPEGNRLVEGEEYD